MKKIRLVSYLMIFTILLTSVVGDIRGVLTSYAQTKGTLQTHKKVEDNGDETFKITLEVKGQGSISQSKDADIVMVIDSSGSMIDKMDQVKTAAKNFSKNLLSSGDKDKVRISVATFNCNPGNTSGVGASSTTMLDFTSDIKAINTSIDDMGMGGGTHTQDGIWRASDILYRSRADANRYVVFFTDGLPSESYNYESHRIPGHDISYKDAQTTYYDYFTGYGAPTQVTIGGIGDTTDGLPPKPQTITVNNQPLYKDVKFYTLGLFTTSDGLTPEEKEEERRKAIAFMKTIQNVVEPDKYGDKYYTEDLNVINDIFMNISNDIKAEVDNRVTSDLVVHDIVTKEFNIVNNSWKMTDLKGTEIPIPHDSIIVSKTPDGCDEITVKVGEVLASSGSLEGGVRISFDIYSKDPYFSGDNIKTNVSADISYKDPATSVEGSQNFLEDPSVNISPKRGSINIRKEIVAQREGNPGVWETIADDKVNKNDKFCISISGNQKYTVDLTGNTQIKLLFYLKGVNTDISNNKDTTLNYFTEGLYGVEELVPMNYEQVEIYVNQINDISNPNWVTFNEYVTNPSNIALNKVKEGKIYINKDNANIDIKVVNTKVCDKFYQDKSSATNEFHYGK